MNETKDNGGIAVIGFRSDGTTTLRKDRSEDYSLTVMYEIDKPKAGRSAWPKSSRTLLLNPHTAAVAMY